MRQRYTHSGRVPPLGMVLGLGFGLVAALPISYLYDYGIIHVPSLKLRACFTVFFGILIGVAAGWGMVLGKVRNTRVAAATGTIASVVALYVSWAAWLILVFEEPYSWIPRLLPRPVAVWRLVRLVNVDGTWGTSGSATKGIELWIIWGLEAVTVVGFGWLAAAQVMKNRPYCENCDHWCKKAGQLLIKPTMQPADLMTSLNEGGLGFLAKATPATSKEPRYSLTWHSCTSCGALNTLSVRLVQPKNSKEVASHLVLSAAEVDLLRDFQGKTQSLVAAATAG